MSKDKITKELDNIMSTAPNSNETGPIKTIPYKNKPMSYVVGSTDIRTTGQQIRNALADDSLEYVINEYSDWDDITDPVFHKKRQLYVHAKKDLEAYIKEMP